MLRLPPCNPIYRFIALDPGTETLGVSVFDINFAERRAYIPLVTTFKASRSNYYNDQDGNVFGDRYARLDAHRHALIQLFASYQPAAIVSESPFMGRFPQAFAALTECMSMIQSAIREYSYSMRLETVDPMTAKQAVGVSKRGSNKELVREGVLKIPDIVFLNCDPSTLDEHSIDSIAVGYSRFKSITNFLGVS